MQALLRQHLTAGTRILASELLKVARATLTSMLALREQAMPGEASTFTALCGIPEEGSALLFAGGDAVQAHLESARSGVTPNSTHANQSSSSSSERSELASGDATGVASHVEALSDDDGPAKPKRSLFRLISRRRGYAAMIDAMESLGSGDLSSSGDGPSASSSGSGGVENITAALRSVCEEVRLAAAL